MSKSRLSEGRNFLWSATAAKSSGDVVYAQSLVGVVQLDAVTGDIVAVDLDGEHRLAKPTGIAFAQGAPVYIETTGDTLASSKAGAKYVGVASAAATSGATEKTVYVIVNAVPGTINVLGT